MPPEMYDQSKRPAPACSKCGGEQKRNYGGIPICAKCHPNLAKALLRV
jgi:ribosomal protein L37AE/L43A